jgi:hypothetical protein
MEVKDAVKLAKAYVADIFEDENIREIGLEETEFVDDKGLWLITVGFRRPFRRSESEKRGTPLVDLSRALGGFSTGPTVYEERWYKVVEIDNVSGSINSMRDRILRSAA